EPGEAHGAAFGGVGGGGGKGGQGGHDQPVAGRDDVTGRRVASGGGAGDRPAGRGRTGGEPVHPGPGGVGAGQGGRVRGAGVAVGGQAGQGASGEPGADGARLDQDHGDPEGGQLHAQGVGDGGDRVLAGVVGAEQRHGHPAHDAAHIDHPSPATLAHRRQE